MAKKTTTKTVNKSANNKTTRVIGTCPKCGAPFEIELPEHEALVLGTAIGKDSGLGTLHIDVKHAECDATQTPIKTSTKAASRRAALVALGYPVYDEESICNSAVEAMSDPLFDRIIKAGGIRNSHVFHQHVVAQYLKMLCDTTKYRTFLNGNFDRRLRARGFRYQWKVVLDMLNRQVHMRKNGDPILPEERMFYNEKLFIDMLGEYINDVLKFFVSLEYHKKRINGRVKYIYKVHRFESALTALGIQHDASYSYITLEDKQAYISHLVRLYNAWKKELNSNGVEKTSHLAKDILSCLNEHAFVEFSAPNREYKSQTKKPKAQLSNLFIGAYKGCGSYFTMRDLVTSEGLLVKEKENENFDGMSKILKRQLSLTRLLGWAQEHEGYWLMGACKEFLRYNNFDVLAHQNAWRIKKLASLSKF